MSTEKQKRAMKELVEIGGLGLEGENFIYVVQCKEFVKIGTTFEKSNG